MHNLGKKSEIYSMESSMENIDYPSLVITSKGPIKFPDGTFEASVILNHKGGEWREDEKGDKVYIERFEVCCIEPGECCDIPETDTADTDDAGESDEGDAAMEIMKSMSRARSKKIMEEGD